MSEYRHEAGSPDLLAKAKADLAEDMKSRDLGAVIWDNATADFHYLPEITLPPGKDGEPRTARVMGIYRYGDELYLIEEDLAGVKMTDFYDKDSEVRPTVVTLSSDIAVKDLGDPEGRKGFTSYEGDLEEWLAIADCYYQALAE